jgi:hypothetical protein
MHAFAVAHDTLFKEKSNQAADVRIRWRLHLRPSQRWTSYEVSQPDSPHPVTLATVTHAVAEPHETELGGIELLRLGL